MTLEAPDRLTPEGAHGRTLDELTALCERAGAHKRRQLAERGIGTPFVRDMYIYHRSPPVKLPAPSRDGWVRLSLLFNEIESERYVIWWHPESDRLRLQLESA